MKKDLFYMMLTAVLLLNSGCATTGSSSSGKKVSGQMPAPHGIAVVSPTIAGLASGLAAQLGSNLRDDDLGNWPCVATTIVDIDNLERSNRFGRTLAENLGTEIFRQGGQVYELRSGNAFYIEPGTGEMTLSRDVDNLAKDIKARAVLTGTYSMGANSISVNIRLINLQDKAILSVATAEIARTPAIDSMIFASNSPRPTAYDRMP